MPLIVFHTRRVRTALQAPIQLGVELFMLALVGSALGMIILAAKQAAAPFVEQVHIDLSLGAVPKYTLLTLARGFAAYVLSLIFTLIIGTIAAHNRRAEKIIIPALDVLQSIPVLGFLPGVVLAMVALLPTRELGLELACVITIFTAQVWNMTFSYHGSVRGIPQPLREVARLQRLNGWQIFRKLEVPSAMIGLVWNSMMSMAGGWFFLTYEEALQLQGHDYRLPGIGSYMKEAIDQNNKTAMWAAVIAMIVMIIAVDQLFWRPIVAWSERYKMEETSGGEKPQAWVLNVLQRSRMAQWVQRHLLPQPRRDTQGAQPQAAGIAPDAAQNQPEKTRLRLSPAAAATAAAMAARPNPNVVKLKEAVLPLVKGVVLVALAGLAAWGAWTLLELLRHLPLRSKDESGADWLHVVLGLGASFLRTAAAVALGAVWTLPVGIWIGLSAKWSRRLQPLIQVAASFPAPMIFPPLAIGLGMIMPFNYGCVVLMLVSVQWYILFNVIAGAAAIPADLKEVTTLYRSSQWQRWTRLYIPCVFPYLVTGLLTAAGGAWNATIAAEIVALPGGQSFNAFGLGAIITNASTTNYSLLAAGVVTMSVFVVLLNRVLWKRLHRLAEERYSLNT